MSIPNDQLPENVLNALQQGNTIEAIKLVRQATGMGLKEAKDLIDSHLSGQPMSITTVTSEGTLPPSVLEALKSGNKIEAIKLLREHSGLGLKEAKEAVEAVQIDANTGTSKLASGKVPKSIIGWLPPLIIAGIVAYYIFRH